MLEFFNRFARLASARSEIVGAAFLVLIIVMMVIPLSHLMIDILLAVNISLSVVLLISAILVSSPLAFSSFPAILLVSTLFRLSLTISTTRLILLEADAGNIVQTFGEFVVGGNVVVGLVIFLIISVVNFLVITKGSERVAEVAARFSLDGMPGKQMSIDSDLRAGLINQAVAKQRRSDLEKESQLFGAMDGAIKFVKNDAIAGLVITAVNLIGGLAIGMLQKDMSFAEAGKVYTILSVGDGLVAILPSLMVSIAAGLIVTRVTKGEADGASTAHDMLRELSSNEKALQISAMVCMLFALVPGMPTMTFLIISGVLLVFWFKAGKPMKTSKKDNIEESSTFHDKGKKGRDGNVSDLLTTSTFSALEVRLPKSIDPATANVIENIFRMARNNLVNHLGILLPVFDFRSHEEEPVEVFVFGVSNLSWQLSDKRLCIRDVTEKITQLPDTLGVQQEKEPLTGRIQLLCEPLQKINLDQLGIEYLTYEDRLREQIECLLIRKMDQLFTLNEYQRHVTGLGEQYAEQLKELERVLPTTKIVSVVQRLLSENVSVKNMRSILNSLIEWGQRERDPQIITDQVRRGLLEQICHQHANQKTLQIFMVSMELEQLIREAVRSDGSISYLDIDTTMLNSIVQSIEQQLGMYLAEPKLPVLVCSMDCRSFFRQMLFDQLHSVPIFSHQEISSALQIKVLGSLTVDDSTNALT